jgi:hypothetical protein
MLSNDKYLEKEKDIFDYLQKKMSIEQKQKFQEELKNDPDLLREVLIIKTIRLEAEYGNSLKYTNQLKSLMLSNPIPPNTEYWKKQQWLRWLYSGLSVFGLSAAIGYYAYKTGRLNPYLPPISVNTIKKEYQLTSEDFNHPHNILPPNDALLRQCLEEYDNQKFDAAVIDFERFLKDKPNQIPFELPYGIAAFRSEQYEKAIAVLTPVSESTIESFASPAKWYLALSYLAMHEEEKARQKCSQLFDNQTFGAKAKALYEKLK